MQPTPHRFAVVPRRRSKTRGTDASPEVALGYALACEDRLKQALWFAKRADAPLLAGRIRAAIKSAGGAIRHRDNWEARARRQNTKGQQT